MKVVVVGYGRGRLGNRARARERWSQRHRDRQPEHASSTRRALAWRQGDHWQRRRCAGSARRGRQRHRRVLGRHEQRQCQLGLGADRARDVSSAERVCARVRAIARRAHRRAWRRQRLSDALHDRSAARKSARDRRRDDHATARDQKSAAASAPTLQPADEAKFVVVAGGGRVGFHLARSLLKNGHEVAVIERDPLVASEIKARLDCPVIVGDGSMTPVQEEAGVSRARVFAAVTGQDEDNLIACQTARMLSKTCKTIARVSNPTNEELYRALGVNATISATSLIENVIEREMPTLQIKTLLSLPGGSFNILELLLSDQAPVIDRPLRDVVLPRDTNVVAILRNGKTVVPRGDTAFKPGDVVIVLVGKESEAQLKHTLLGDQTDHSDEPEHADSH